MRLRSRCSTALALALAVSGVLVLMTAAPVAAHTSLESSEPSDGEVVDEPVVLISLAFNRPVEPAGDGFTVSDEQGLHYRPDSLASSDGQTWQLHFDAPLGSGVYEVWWRVLAEDGHVVEGVFTFAVDVPGSESSAGPPTDSAPEPAAASAEGTAALAEESPIGTSAAGSTEAGSTTSTTTLAAGSETPSAAATAPRPTAASVATVPAESRAASEEGTPRLARRSSGATGAQRLAEAVRILGLLATLAIVGGLAFAMFIVRSELSEQARVRRVLFTSGIALVAAAVATALIQAAVIEDDWGAAVSPEAITEALAAPFGIAVGLRMLGGLVVLGLSRPRVPHSDTSRFGTLGVIGAALVVISYSFDGHTVTEGPRLLHATANATHVTAAAVWSGGLALLADLLRRRRGDTGVVVGPLMRFSQLASVSLVLAGVAGTVMALLVMDRFADLWSTGWGRLLIAKIALVALAAVIGARNRWVHMPAAAQHASVQAQSLVQQRLFRAVSIEAAVLLAAGVVTAFLVGASAL